MLISYGSSDVCSSDLLQDKQAGGVALQRQKAGDACACRLRGYPAAARGARQRKDPRLPQYRRWRLVTSREVRRAWRFTAEAALRLRPWVGFSSYSRLRVSASTPALSLVRLKRRRARAVVRRVGEGCVRRCRTEGG